MQQKKHRIMGTLAIFLFFIAIATKASAVTWNELGDAGDTPLTAQTPIGTGALNTIIGTLSPATDTDVFRIYIPAQYLRGGYDWNVSERRQRYRIIYSQRRGKSCFQ